MTDKNDKLSEQDIRMLMADPTPGAKINMIKKLSFQYNKEDFTDSQIALAEQIFRLLLRQAEIEVRKTLSENLMGNSKAPHDVVMSLAKDVEEVALPMLEFSEVLGDDDLAEIIHNSQKSTYHSAIAKREHISENITDALVNTGDETVVENLLKNEGAEISEKSYETVVNTFNDKENIVDSLIHRGSLSKHIMEQMTKKVSSAIQKKLETKYNASFGDLNSVFTESAEMAAIRFVGKRKIDEDLIKLVDDLEKTDKLEESLDPVIGILAQLLDGIEIFGQLTPLSALAAGHLTLFEVSLSRLSGVRYSNVKKLVSDKTAGLHALYEKAQLPPNMYDAANLVIGVIEEMDAAALRGDMIDGEPAPRARDDLRLMIKNIMIASKNKDIKGVAHFISMIEDKAELKKK